MKNKCFLIACMILPGCASVVTPLGEGKETWLREQRTGRGDDAIYYCNAMAAPVCTEATKVELARPATVEAPAASTKKKGYGY